MISEHFGMAIGNKFNADGSFRAFAGNTVVSSLVKSPVFFELCSLQNRLVEEGRGKYVIPLPPESFHMTVFEGVCDQVRDPAHWTSKISVKAPIEEVSKLLAPLFRSVPFTGMVRMRFSYLRIDTGISIGLETLDESDDRIIRDYRDRLSDAMGIRFPDHDVYRFHIGLAYGRKTAGDEDILFSRIQDCFFDEFLKKEISFEVPTPHFCSFSDMSCFTPYDQGDDKI